MKMLANINDGHILVEDFPLGGKSCALSSLIPGNYEYAAMFVIASTIYQCGGYYGGYSSDCFKMGPGEGGG